MIYEYQYFEYSEGNTQIIGLTTEDKIRFIFKNTDDRIEIEIYCSINDKDTSQFSRQFNKWVDYFELNKSDIATKLVHNSLNNFSMPIVKNSKNWILLESPIELMITNMKQAILSEHKFN